MWSSNSPRSVPLCVALLAALVALAPSLDAQQAGEISGRVTDSGTGLPVGAVQAQVPGLDIGVFTTQDGRFTLANVPAGTHSVSFQRIGYRAVTEENVTVTAGQTTIVDVQIATAALALDEVIVTGTPGGTQRRAIGNAVTRLSASDVTATRPVTSVQHVLQGRTPGLNFGRSGGNVGEGGFIRIRGVSSFGLGTQPLIYVDGIRMDNSTDLGPNLPTTGSGQRSASALDDINPNDIESIEVIKGPAAATLYGTEASAGVIQIITKRGQAGAPQFDAQVSQGANFLLDPRGLIGSQYRCPAGPPCSEAEIIEFNILDAEDAGGHGSPIGYGHTQRYNLSVRGGSDAVNYFLSTDFSGQEGIRSEQNWNDRFSARANLGVLLTDALNMDVSLGYVDGSTRFGTGLIESGGLWPHLMWASGAGLPDGSARGYLAYTPEEFDIPEATRDYTRTTASVSFSHSPLPWLQQRLTLGMDRGEEESITLFPRDELGTQGPWGSASIGEITVLRPTNTEMSFDYSASARYDLNDEISLTSSVGAQYFSSEFNRYQMSGREFPAPPITGLEGATERSASRTFRQQKSLGVYFQQEMGWNNRVFLTAAVRGDDSSTFGADFDAAIYPKFSATWVISEENFFNVNPVSSLRLRGAWGQAGRQPATFDAVTLFGTSVASGGNAAITPRTFGNPDVGPEVGTEIELGFDAAFLDDRISGEFTYFHQRISDALVSVPIAPSHGFPGSQADNLGRLDNWGYEAALTARVFDAPAWSFDLGASLSYTMNEIKDLGGRSPSGSLRIGHPWPNRTSTHIVSGEFADPTTGAPNPFSMMCDAGVSMAPEGADQAAYGFEPGGEVVSCWDILFRPGGPNLLLGPTFSPWSWNLDGTFTFGGVQVFGMVDAEHGRWMNDFNVSCRHDYCGFPNSKKSLTRDDPVFVMSSLHWASYPTDTRHWQEHDASYVRLREVGVRYQMPQSLADRVGADRASLSLAARNLWYLWRGQEEMGGVRIPSPEMGDPNSQSGFSLFQWPPLSSFEATLRVSF